MIIADDDGMSLDRAFAREDPTSLKSRKVGKDLMIIALEYHARGVTHLSFRQIAVHGSFIPITFKVDHHVVNKVFFVFW